MSSSINVLLNGGFDDLISVKDRGLAYGHGVFETIALYQHQFEYLEEHLTRLSLGCQVLGITSSAQKTAALMNALYQDLEQLHRPHSGVVKIIVTAGEGGRGYQYSSDIQPNRIVLVTDLPDHIQRNASEGVKMRVCQTRLSCNPALAGLKHLNRLEQVLARAEWQDPSIYEGLLQGCDQYIAEGVMSNLFFVQQGYLCTPDLTQYGVAGIMRQKVLEWAEELSLAIKVGQFTLESLWEASEVFITNSLIGIVPVVQIEQLKFSIGNQTRQLQAYRASHRLC